MRRTEREMTDAAVLAGILDRAAYANLAFLDCGAPAVIPVSFGYRIERGSFVFYFHSAGAGRKIECLKADARVSFSAVGENRIVIAEPACRSTCHYESVIAAGRIEFITAADGKRDALDCIMNHCGAPGSFEYPEPMLVRTAILRLVAETISGKSNIPRSAV